MILLTILHVHHQENPTSSHILPPHTLEAVELHGTSSFGVLGLIPSVVYLVCQVPAHTCYIRYQIPNASEKLEGNLLNGQKIIFINFPFLCDSASVWQQQTRGPAGGVPAFQGAYDNRPECFALGLSQKVQVATDRTL